MQGVGIGGGGGLSIGIPGISLSGSLDQFPADGIGCIVKGPASVRVYSKQDFAGEILVVSLSAGKQISGSVAGVLWLDRPVETMLNLSCSPRELEAIAKNTFALVLGLAAPRGVAGVTATRLYKFVKAAGMFTGLNAEVQLVGAGADAFLYKVVAS